MGAAKVPLWRKRAPGAFYFGPKITSQSQEAQFHPLLPSVRTRLGKLSTAAKTSVLQSRLAWLTTHKKAAEAALTTLSLAPGLPDQIAAESAMPPLDWPVGKDKADPRLSDRAFRLKVGQSGYTDKYGRPLPEDVSTDQAYAALTDSTVVTTAASDPSATAALLLQMRCLADIYTRWEVCARLTADLLSSQLASPVLSKAEMLARGCRQKTTRWREATRVRTAIRFRSSRADAALSPTCAGPATCAAPPSWRCRSPFRYRTRLGTSRPSISASLPR